MADLATQFLIRKLNIQTDLLGPILFTVDTTTYEQNLGTIVQRGQYTLSNGVAFVSLPRALISAASAANISFLLTPYAANPQYITSIAKASAMNSIQISSISGFSVSGTGSDMGAWLALGYR
jgi:hypothetical protein